MVFLFVIPHTFFAQQNDTTTVTNIEFITDQLESIAEKTDIIID